MKEESGVTKLSPFISGRVSLHETTGEKCLRDFYQWYRGTTVHLIAPPWIDVDSRIVSARFFPVSVRRGVFKGETERLAREKSKKWLREMKGCSGKTCVHYEHTFFLPPKIDAKGRICILTIFLNE